MKITNLKLIPIMIGISITSASMAQTVTGTGTFRFLPRWNSNPTGSSVINSIIFDDGSFIGIGYSGAGSAYRLDVNGDINFGGSSTGTNSGLYLGTDKILWHNGDHSSISLGWNAGSTGSLGSECTFIGSGAGNLNNYIDNTAVGYNALTSNSLGGHNTAVGAYALNDLNGHSSNNAFGEHALKHVNGDANNGFGTYVLGNGTCTGSWNNAFGYGSMYNMSTGNQNSAFGDESLRSCTTGTNNCAFGDDALSNVQSGNANSAFGGAALAYNLASNNSALGYKAFYNNTSGADNTAIGYQAGLYNQTGSDNSIFGYNAGGANAGATNSFSNNCFFGSQAGYNMKVSSDNLAIGYQALYTQNYGTSFSSSNIAIGNLALKTTNPTSTTNGYRNIAIGYQAGRDNQTGSFNTMIGFDAGMQQTSPNYNTFVGYQAGYTTSTGGNNTAVGYGAGYSNNTGTNNSFLGYQAGFFNTSGTYNAFVGQSAGYSNTTGSDNTCIGYLANVSGTTSNLAAIGYGTSANSTNDFVCGNSVVSGVYSTNGFFATSDGRFKTNISENVQGLAFINKLRPVTYNMNTQALDDFMIRNIADSMKSLHKQGLDFSASMARVHSGFIAQEVELAAQQVGFTSSIVRHPENEDGAYALNYAEIVVPLVKAVQELSKTVDSLKGVISGASNRKSNSDNSPSSSGNDDKGASINVELSDLDVAVLNEAAPNPFAEQTLIIFNIPLKAEKVQMLFYDGAGTLIKTVDISKKGKGQMYVFANDLSSGAYSYTLIVDSKVIATKKMVKQ